MSRSEPMIPAVKDGKEKEQTYRKNIDNFNKARKSGFYYQCLWIVYAMAEDRTSALLYYLGFTNADRRKVTGTKRIKKDIREIFGIGDNKKYSFDSMRGKVTRIHELMDWSRGSHDGLSEYRAAVQDCVTSVLAEDEKFCRAMDYLSREWIEKRNELVHALFNKKSELAESELEALVEASYAAVRDIDNAVGRLKRKNLRKKFKIQ